MPVVYVTSPSAGSGKTGVATAIARHFAYLGLPTRLARVSGVGERPMQDAAFFASLDFVPGSPSVPVASSAVTDPGAGALLVVEGDPDGLPAGAIVVVVGRGDLPAVPAGVQPAAVVVTDLTRDAADALPPSVAEAPVTGFLSDRTLAGFEPASVRQVLDADILVEGDPVVTTCDHLVIAPIGSDAGQPYFRLFPRPCVVVRYDKTDQHMAALRSNPVCLVLTGGRQPSEYTLDAARAKGVPVYLARPDTENTVILLEGIFDVTRFTGEAKVERMCELLDSSAVIAALGVEVPATAL